MLQGLRRSALCLVVLCLQATGSGQQPAPTPSTPDTQPSPIFRTEANFVRVDAFVTEGGRPVLGLEAKDFEIREDGVPQNIETFEHVLVRPAGPQTSRIEPNTVREANQMATDPRSRVFVLFLDTPHVMVASSHRMRQPLINLLNRTLGQDDLIGVVTPEMSAKDLTLARRTTTIEGILTEHWHWGDRDSIIPLDESEQQYQNCYPERDYPGIAAEMIARRRERRTIDALGDLVTHLRGLREERKAILTISEGWRLYRENQSLARPLKDQGIPGKPEVFLGPDGRLTTRNPQDAAGSTLYDCDRDRMRLAFMDNEPEFRQLFDRANRANATFYTIDPRGLAVFDGDLSTKDPFLPVANQAQLRFRINTLQELALNTDGIAVVNSNDTEGQLKKIAEDLTSYYLLGYYSTNAKLDGRFRKIAVNVKRPGTDVRARRGYLAATADEAAKRTPAADAPAPSATEAAMTSAFQSLAAIRSETRVRLRATPGVRPVTGPNGVDGVYLVAELDASLAATPEWKGGGSADVVLNATGGQTVASTSVSFGPGERRFLAELVTPKGLAAGDYVIQARIRPAAGGLPLGESVPMSVAPADAMATSLSARLLRSTGTRAHTPTADLRFRRTERLRVEVPSTSASSSRGELLDKKGATLGVPVETSTRADGDGGAEWLVADVNLAPLAPGDYLVALKGENDARSILAAFRVVP